MKTIIQGAMLSLIAALLPLNGAGSDLPAKEIPFSKGINMGYINGWGQSSHQQIILEKEDFAAAKQMGADVLRVSIEMRTSAGPAPSYVLEPAFFAQLDSTVLWASEQGLSLIFDNVAIGLPEDFGAWLTAVWSQVAEHYKGKSSKLLYQLNSSYSERNNERFGLALQSAIDAIRTIDAVPTIIVNAASMEDPHSLSKLPYFTDPNLYYGFNLSHPILFTFQGITGLDMKLASSLEIPFPHDEKTMPPCPALATEDMKAQFADYPKVGTADSLKAYVQAFKAFAQERNVPLLCLEFAAFKGGHHPEYRLEWNRQVVQYFEEAKIPSLFWDFSLLCKQSNGGYVEQDLDTDLIKILGFNQIEQKTGIVKPVTAGFSIFDEGFERGFKPEASCTVSSDDASSGILSLKLANFPKYQPMIIDFKRYLDLSKLDRNKAGLHFRYNTTKDDPIDFRFQDTKECDGVDRPWWSEYQLITNPDGNWHSVFIPLASFKEGGTWETMWEPACGKFDWSKIDYLVLTPTKGALEGPLYIDELSLMNNKPAIGISPLAEDFYKYMYYNSQMDVIYVSGIENVSLLVTGLQGQVYLNEKIGYKGSLSLGGLASGVYIARLYKDGAIIETMKLAIK